MTTPSSAAAFLNWTGWSTHTASTPSISTTPSSCSPNYSICLSSRTRRGSAFCISGAKCLARSQCGGHGSWCALRCARSTGHLLRLRASPVASSPLRRRCQMISRTVSCYWARTLFAYTMPSTLQLSWHGPGLNRSTFSGSQGWCGRGTAWQMVRAAFVRGSCSCSSAARTSLTRSCGRGVPSTAT